MVVILVLTLLLVGFGAFEYLGHRRRVDSIPIRIHVNGTRGKSSVTRLIAAGLREGGIRTLAKVTGTLPRIIDETGLEIPIIRLHPVNIIEQVKVFRFFRRHQPEAVVVECMAVMPDYQWVCEHRFVHSTIGVITNARMDHVREMGPSLENIAESLANTVPNGAVLYTSDNRASTREIFRRRCEANGSEFHASDESEITVDTLRLFSHVEYPANVALALDVCERAGVDRSTALKGMVRAYPDPGALHVYEVQREERKVVFLNALAANDAESTYAAWERTLELYPDVPQRILLLNTRADRFDRSVQLLEMVAQQVQFDTLLNMGESTDMLTQHLRRLKIPKQKVVKIGHVHADKAWDAIWQQVEGEAIVFALGNAGHGGLEVARLFRKRRQQHG